ncbi:MAG: aldehyde ferredoxin oxidoreductase family protein [Eubacteriales bacterium]|jgi:aldehyde:ferredoxin oxidoreductase|nr:aldehyde ferredoxin oxidoreductase family protein [Eubacteriales bacterium]NLF46960.1 aldehyde ferredoxin oxidoreductase family protein [Clostridiales bacterium]
MFKDARLLYVDLNDRTKRIKTLDGETYRKYPGGSALGMYILLKEMDPKVDPLSPENTMVFSTSPLTGFPISGNSRMNLAARSPLTGAAGDSQVGGSLPAAFAANGYDALIVKGKADTPVYIYIDGDKVEIRDASAMWGKITGDADLMLEEDINDKKIESAIIGPAGETLLPYANIMHQRSRAFGRNGMGAVMGSKNLKALVVHKQPPRKPVDPEGMKTLTLNVKERMHNNPTIEATTQDGSGGCVEAHAGEGFLPSYNFDKGIMDDWESTAGYTLTKKYLKQRETCFGCAIRCKRVVDIPGVADPFYGGPEYETMATFGSYCGQTDLAKICHANQLCNMYGIDTITCGATIAWAMDCFEKGILTTEDTDGLEVKYGNGDVFGPLIEKIVKKEPGIGALLAKGSVKAAEELGRGSQELLVATKGQEWPGHMVQFKPNLVIHYAVNPYGADHQSVEHDPALMAPEDDQNWIWPNMLDTFEKCDSYGVLDDNKVKFSWVTQKFYAMMDTLCLCQFAWGPAWQLYGPQELIEYCKYAVGWEVTLEELQEIGERRINMMRLFNEKLGFSRSDDTVPKKAFLPIEYSEGEVAQLTEEGFQMGLDTYYELAGWDKETGNPKPETKKGLDLEWV